MFSQLISIFSREKKQYLVWIICVFVYLKHLPFSQTWSLIWSNFISILLANFEVSSRVKSIDNVLGRLLSLRLETQRITTSLRLFPPQVILTELYSTGFQRSFSDEDDLTAIADSDVVYAFQAPPLCSHRSSTSSHSGSDLSWSFRGCAFISTSLSVQNAGWGSRCANFYSKTSPSHSHRARLGA